MRSKNQVARSYLLAADKEVREIIDALDENRFGGLMEKAVGIRHHILTAVSLLDEEILEEVELPEQKIRRLETRLKALETRLR